MHIKEILTAILIGSASILPTANGAIMEKKGCLTSIPFCIQLNQRYATSAHFPGSSPLCPFVPAPQSGTYQSSSPTNQSYPDYPRPE